VPKSEVNKSNGKVTYYTHIKWIPRRKPWIHGSAPEGRWFIYKKKARLKIAYFEKTSPERAKTDNSHLQTKFHGASGKIIKTAGCLTDSCLKTGIAGLKMGLNSVDIKKTFLHTNQFEKRTSCWPIYTFRATQKYMVYGVCKHRPRRTRYMKVEKIQKTSLLGLSAKTEQNYLWDG
jgi:hypothetical protein